VEQKVFHITSINTCVIKFSFKCVFSIRKKTQVNKIDALKEIIRAWGMNPEQFLTRDALAEGATTHKNPEDLENHQLTILSQQLKDLICKDAAV
jgi:hypothetical protein